MRQRQKISNIDIEKETWAAELRGSLLKFTEFFFLHLTGRNFIVSNPAGREPHHITVCRALTTEFRTQKEGHGLIINMPPGYGKSVMASMWVAWSMAQYPDCNFLYVSYSHVLAASHTAFIKQIMSSRIYQYLFEVSIRQDTRSKDHFETTAGGHVAAFGSSGAITGRNAGIPGLKRFSGAIIIDDPIKPNEAHSDTIREGVLRNYQETLLQRPRDVNVPIIFIGQRLHEDDLSAYLGSGVDVRIWDKIILKGIDDAGNALYPEVQPLSYLRELEAKQPYVFASQIQQDPLPSGGGLFKPEWFVLLDFEPQIMSTFITADTAETDKNYNDATAFSFFGVYEIETMGRKTGELGLHWLDSIELRIEPKDLKDAFLDFWGECMHHPVPPLLAAIEKKSTGVTLLSVLQDLRGIAIRNIERPGNQGSKTDRFIEIQGYIASKRISITKDAKHANLCIDHMKKITANDSHRHDDIADTLADAIRIALIDKTIHNVAVMDDKRRETTTNLATSFKRKLKVGAQRDAQYRQNPF